MLFFSDLDKTLVYSGYPDHVCVERCEDKEITYMTSRAVDLFNGLISLENMTFIPCTLRSYEQTYFSLYPDRFLYVIMDFLYMKMDK